MKTDEELDLVVLFMGLSVSILGVLAFLVLLIGALCGW